MGVRQQMTMRATVQRDQAAADPWGGSGDPDWQPHLTDQPCRAWVQVETEATDEDRTVRLEDRRVIVPHGTDIVPGDRIAQVADRRGQLLFDGPMAVQTVVRRDDHLELLVAKVS